MGCIIIIKYIYHAIINALSAHMIHINVNMIFYTHVEHSPTKTIYIKVLLITHTHWMARIHRRKVGGEKEMGGGGGGKRQE